MRRRRYPLLVAGLTSCLALAFLYVGCRGSGALAQGGWVWEGDDVIVSRPEGDTTRAAVFSRVLRAVEEGGLTVDVLDRESGYLRTDPHTVEDTLSVRLITVVTDSATVEVAAQYTEAGASESEWRRVAWNEGFTRVSGAWRLMKEVAKAAGSIQGYDRDPTGIWSSACGGRRCGDGEVCRGHVCRIEEEATASVASETQPPRADEHAGVGEHRDYLGQVIIDRTNQERTAHGREALAVDTTLSRIACWHNQDMIANTYQGHEDSDGRGPTDRVAREHRRLIRGVVGENVTPVGGLEPSDSRSDRKRHAEAYVEGWMDSPGHRRNILNPEFTHLGACYTAHDPVGKATQLFAGVVAYLERPLPWRMSPGDSLSTSVTPVKASEPPVWYVFVPVDESLERALQGAFDAGDNRRFEGVLQAPGEPGLYEPVFLFRTDQGSLSPRRGPVVRVQ